MVEFNDLRRYGNVIHDVSYVLKVGFLRVFIFEYENKKYLVELTNGIVNTLKEI